MMLSCSFALKHLTIVSIFFLSHSLSVSLSVSVCVSLTLALGIQEFPENIKNCKVLAIVEASVNPISK